MVTEGLDEFSKRTTSIIVQIIIYMIIVFLGNHSTHTHKLRMETSHSLWLRNMVMTLATFIILKTVPKFIPKIIARSGGYTQEAIDYIFSISKAGGIYHHRKCHFGNDGCRLFFRDCEYFRLWLRYYDTAFFLRIGGGVYKNAAKISNLLLPDRVKALPQSHRNPSKILNIIGSYIGEMVGFSSDILSSYMFAIIACIVATNSVTMVGRFGGTALDTYIAYPIYLVTAGLGISILVYYFGKIRNRYRFQNLLLESIYMSIFLNGIAAYLISSYLGLNRPLFGPIC